MQSKSFQTTALAIAITLTMLWSNNCSCAQNSLDAAATAETKSTGYNEYLYNITSRATTKLLGWIIQPFPRNVCAGYYSEPKAMAPQPPTQDRKKTPITITADQPAFFTEYGTSELEGNVKISQEGRAIYADKITIYRDPMTQKITTVKLLGNIKLYEPGKRLIAESAVINFTQNSIILDNVLYRLTFFFDNSQLNAWGKAAKFKRNPDNSLHLYEGTYTTCPPTNNAWHLAAKKIIFDKDSGVARATALTFYVKDMPILYAPKHSFPTNKMRKSGFLYPTVAYAATNGISLAMPYYVNLAPNYDLTLTPNYISKRGLLTKAAFRYLTTTGAGTLNVSFIPNDNNFVDFQDHAEELYPTANAHTLSDLINASPSRGRLTFANLHQFNQHWYGSLNANYVTDDYFLQDYGENSIDLNTDQLLNQGEINYASSRWHFLGRIQSFLTLHTVNQAIQAQNQYMRLPQLLLTNFGQENNINYQFNAEYINFDHKKDYTTGENVPVGQRLNFTPTFNMPLVYNNFYTRPRIELNLTRYHLRDQQPGLPLNITRFIPIFSLENGISLSRPGRLFNNSYLQILEPKLFYLFVPESSQADIPIFDTTLPVFDINQLFRPNRFSGNDRIGDANQLALGVTTRLLDQRSGQEKLHASLGQIYSLHRHTICLNNDCTLDPLASNNLSPLVGDLQYFITSQWNIAGNFAWKSNNRKIQNSSLNLQYFHDANHILNLGYNYLRNGDPDLLLPNNLDRVNIAIVWPIKTNWKILGNWNYNISHGYAQTYFYGLEYEGCCWAVRLVQNRAFIGQDTNNQTKFNNTFYLQILLKGLGNFGHSDAGSLLSSSVPGFQDNFATGLKL